MAIQGLSPGQLLQFQQERNNYSTDLGRNKATSIYNQQLGNLQLGRNTRQFNTDWDRRRVGLPTDYIRRGLLNSGIYHTGLQNYATDRATGLSDLLLRHQLQQAGLILQDRAYEDTYAQQMANNYAREYGTQADIAAQLRSVL